VVEEGAWSLLMRGGEVVELVLSSLVLGMSARSPAAAAMLALLMLFVRREAATRLCMI